METAYAQLTTPNGTSIFATPYSKCTDYIRQFPERSIADHLAKLPQDELFEALKCILDRHFDAKLNEIKLEHADVPSLVARLIAEIDWTQTSNESWNALARSFASELTQSYQYNLRNERGASTCIPILIAMMRDGHIHKSEISYSNQKRIYLYDVENSVISTLRSNNVTMPELFLQLPEDTVTRRPIEFSLGKRETVIEFLCEEYKQTLLSRFQNTHRSFGAQIEYCLSLCNHAQLVGILYDAIAIRFNDDEIALINYFKERTIQHGDQTHKLRVQKDVVRYVLAPLLSSQDIINLAQTDKAWRNFFTAPSADSTAWSTMYKEKFHHYVPTSFPKKEASWFRLFQQAHFKSKDKWGRKAPPFRTFLKAMNETITDYPADLVYKADRGDFHWRIASSKRRGSKSVNKTPHNPTKQTVN